MFTTYLLPNPVEHECTALPCILSHKIFSRQPFTGRLLWGNSGATVEPAMRKKRTSRTNRERTELLKAFAVTDQEALCGQTFRSEKLHL